MDGSISDSDILSERVCSPVPVPMPISVPSECIDLLPREMWPVYHEMFPSGLQELPATVPMDVWRAHMKQYASKRGGNQIPPPPPIWKAYWGRISSGPALVDRKKKKAPSKEPEPRGAPSGPCPPVPKAFWDRYFQVFPMGHANPGSYAPLDGKPAYDDNAHVKPRYIVRNGSICVRINDDTENPLYVPSTGCDAFDKHGKWLGPG
jgi:hypothetical protein